MRALLSVCLGGAVACGGASPPAADPAEPPREKIVAEHDPSIHEDEGEEEDEDDGDELEVEGLSGHLDPYDIERGIAPHSEALADCYHARVRRMRYVDGKVEMTYKVGRDGTVKSVYLSQSDLGAWPIESCLLQIARGMRFSKPRGRGDADFTIPLDFTSGRSRARWLGEEASLAEVDEYLAQLDECEGGAGTVSITLYVGPRGKVKSVGFASRGGRALSDEWAACAEQRILGWQLSDPRGRIAKLGFQYNAK